VPPRDHHHRATFGLQLGEQRCLLNDLRSSWVGHRAHVGAAIGGLQARALRYRQGFVATLLAMQGLPEIAIVDGMACSSPSFSTKCRPGA
jgi:hypothetical protein